MYDYHIVSACSVDRRAPLLFFFQWAFRPSEFHDLGPAHMWAAGTKGGEEIAWRNANYVP